MAEKKTDIPKGLDLAVASLGAAAGSRCYASQGRILFVHDGISDGRTFATFWRPRPWTLRRFKSPHLPLRKTREEAQADLDRYAAEHGLPEVMKPCLK